jgi:excisionase family DNA binding protein
VSAPIILSLREAATKSGVSASRLRRLAASGVLEAQKAGTYWVVSAAALDDFMALERPRGVRRSARGSPG